MHVSSAACSLNFLRVERIDLILLAFLISPYAICLIYIFKIYYFRNNFKDPEICTKIFCIKIVRYARNIPSTVKRSTAVERHKMYVLEYKIVSSG